GSTRRRPTDSHQQDALDSGGAPAQQQCFIAPAAKITTADRATESPVRRGVYGAQLARNLGAFFGDCDDEQWRLEPVESDVADRDAWNDAHDLSRTDEGQAFIPAMMRSANFDVET